MINPIPDIRHWNILCQAEFISDFFNPVVVQKKLVQRQEPN